VKPRRQARRILRRSYEPQSARRQPLRGVLILECQDKGDPGSEGRFLAHMFDLMEIPNQYIEVRTKEQFLGLLESAPYEFVRITTHGTVHGTEEEFEGFWTPSGTVRVEDLESLKGCLTGRHIISTACCSGSLPFSRSLLKHSKCRCYIAPEGSPKFHNAILFSHVFYHKYYVLKRPYKVAFQEYSKRYKNPHDFRLTRGGR